MIKIIIVFFGLNKQNYTIVLSDFRPMSTSAYPKKKKNQTGDESDNFFFLFKFNTTNKFTTFTATL